MRTAQAAGPVVLLSESEAAPSLAARLAPSGRSWACYGSVEELVREQPLSSVAVLVVLVRARPKGILLVALGRMKHEYPAMQKVAVMEAPPPLPIAEYLAACDVDLVWTGSGEDKLERLSAVVERMHERTGWIVS
ncbi:MAG: hypothetical protein HY705_02875 [Gemmatimonadetes bacterium]|nr:hypothetical protein [Gemmatimonadota bacterium]